MPLDVFEISPVAGGPAINGDLSALKINTTQALAADAATMLVGTFPFFGLWFEHATFLRFEMTVPEGSVISGVRVRMVSNGNASGVTLQSQGGFIKPDGMWELASGLPNWINNLGIPFAEWGKGASSDPTVWWDDAPAFNTLAATAPNSGDIFDFGDGIASSNAVTGLVAQLQSYLDYLGNEALRGTGNTPDGIPVCFQIHKPWVGNVHNAQTIYPSDNGLAFVRPQLEVLWAPPPPGEADSDLVLSESASATLRSRATVSADLALGETGSASIRSRATVDADLDVKTSGDSS